MAEMWKPHAKEVYLNWISRLLTEPTQELTPWELTFVSSVEMHLTHYPTLTRQQASKLEQIYAQKTA